eukprot:6479940-Amphidinium_carterae.1
MFECKRHSNTSQVSNTSRTDHSFLNVLLSTGLCPLGHILRAPMEDPISLSTFSVIGNAMPPLSRIGRPRIHWLDNMHTHISILVASQKALGTRRHSGFRFTFYLWVLCLKRAMELS